LETRKSLETIEAVPLGALVRAVLESKGPMIATKGIGIDAALDEAIAVRGDRFLLQQAIANLLQNAIDFSPAGGRVAVRTAAQGRSVVLTVEDEGPGIPDYAVEKIFNRFYSLQRPDTGRKSTGLGLNFVKEVATLHGGEIRLENLETKGARATLSLPVS